jgi:hypothetical protein
MVAEVAVVVTIVMFSAIKATEQSLIEMFITKGSIE